MVGENFLTEEEVLKELKINKAQLEEFIKSGKILPSYQEGQRKFKATEVENIKVSLSAAPPPPVTTPPVGTPPPVESAPPTPQAEDVGSTRVIEPPKKAPKLKVKQQTPPPTEKPGFLKEPTKSKAGAPNIGKLNGILLIVSLVILLLSVGSLYFTWKGNALPNFLLTLLNAISQLGG
ncbi:MAG: helix-turn-helix domain-containing protein [Caldiserica bacterium]|nr:helix-turn-helix domain-containing protein [Caldisericota bacterium]